MGESLKDIVLWCLMATTPVVFTSCFREINVENINFEDRLVIEARITDEVLNHTVKLTRTVPLRSDTIFMEEDAEVELVIGENQRISFNEASPGLYVANQPFGATTDVDYQLLINTTDGRAYQSTVERMIATPPIDRIESDFQRFQIALFEADGTFRFSYDAEIEANENQLYLIEWSETFLIRVPFSFEV